MEKSAGGTYKIPCKINGLALKFIFDTGASDVSISATEALFMFKHGYLLESDVVGSQYYQIANGDIVEGTEILIREIELGGLKLTNVAASISHNLEAPLLLGQSALSKLGVIQIDYSSNQLIISKNSYQAQSPVNTNTPKDTDNDGLTDAVDKCPYEKGTVENYGCPSSSTAPQTNTSPNGKSLQYKKIGEVFFDSGSTQIDKTAIVNMEYSKNYILSKNCEKVYLYGHASTDGSAKANKELATKRAEAVRQQLINMGIDAAKIEILSFGDEMPASGDVSKSGSVDRRVDIIVTILQ